MQQIRQNLREMWQRFTAGAKDTSQSAGAYLDRQRKVVALRSELRKAEADRGGLYAQMGRKVYALHLKEKVANRDLLRSCQEIDELNTLIEAKKTQVEALLAIPDDEEVEIEDETEVPEEEADAPEEQRGEAEETDEAEEEGDEAEEQSDDPEEAPDEEDEAEDKAEASKD